MVTNITKYCYLESAEDRFFCHAAKTTLGILSKISYNQLFLNTLNKC
jgi:hypothetical protein